MDEEELRKAIETGIEGATAAVQPPALQSCGGGARKGRVVATVPNSGAVSALIFLKARGFEHLSSVSCTDWLEEGELELVYHLWSYQDKIHLMLKARLPREDSRAVTATPVFRHAQTYEREIHEMYGVVFEGNARLTSFLLDHWQGPPPMRRDFDTRAHVKEKFGVEERAT